MDFDLTEREAFYRDRVRAFVETRVRPRIGDYKADLAAGDRWEPLGVIEELKPLAKEAGLWNLFMPPAPALPHVDDSFAFEGTQLTNLEYALCAEEMGRILWSAEVFNCSAPDTGNMEVLHRYGTREQKEQWLRPLMNGDIRSAFRGRMSGTVPASGTGKSIVRDTPPSLDGSAVASARITIGASSPLAPCTVITRTAFIGVDGSRLISTSPRENQAMKRSSEAIS